MYNLETIYSYIDFIIIQKSWIVIFSINASSNTVSKTILRPSLRSSLRSSLRPSLYSKSTIDILWEINSSFVSLVYIDYLCPSSKYSLTYDRIIRITELVLNLFFWILYRYGYIQSIKVFTNRWFDKINIIRLYYINKNSNVKKESFMFDTNKYEIKDNLERESNT